MAVKNKIVFIVVFMLVVSEISMASTPDILVALRKNYNKKASFQTDFDLDIYWAVREKHEKKSGRIFFSSGDKFRAEVGNYVWVSDGYTYWQYSKGTNQVIIKQLLDIDLSSHPSQVIENYLFKLNYSVKEKNDKQTILFWKYNESDEKKLAKSVTLWVDNKKKILKKLHVVDVNGNESTYIFKKTKLNVNFPESVFELQIPKGANVFDARE